MTGQGRGCSDRVDEEPPPGVGFRAAFLQEDNQRKSVPRVNEAEGRPGWQRELGPEAWW